MHGELERVVLAEAPNRNPILCARNGYPARERSASRLPEHKVVSARGFLCYFAVHTTLDCTRTATGLAQSKFSPPKPTDVAVAWPRFFVSQICLRATRAHAGSVPSCRSAPPD